MGSQLHLSAVKVGLAQGSPVSILRVDPNVSIVSVEIVDTAGQKKEWAIPLSGAQLSFGVVPEAASFPEFFEGRWVSFLSARMSSGE
jgi:hypothetical protein